MVENARPLPGKEIAEIKEAAERDRHEDPEPIEDWYTRVAWRLRLRASALRTLLLLHEIERLKSEAGERDG